MSEKFKRRLSRFGLLVVAVSMLVCVMCMCAGPACETPVLHLLAAWWAFLECPLIIITILEGSGKEKP